MHLFKHYVANIAHRKFWSIAELRGLEASITCVKELLCLNSQCKRLRLQVINLKSLMSKKKCQKVSVEKKEDWM